MQQLVYCLVLWVYTCTFCIFHAQTNLVLVFFPPHHMFIHGDKSITKKNIFWGSYRQNHDSCCYQEPQVLMISLEHIIVAPHNGCLRLTTNLNHIIDHHCPKRDWCQMNMQHFLRYLCHMMLQLTWTISTCTRRFSVKINRVCMAACKPWRKWKKRQKGGRWQQ